VRILHAIHDFLPRHRAGSEIYAFELCRAQLPQHDVTVLCADFDPSRTHGTVAWRVHEGVPVVEVVNNWVCASFEDTYRPPLVADRIAHVLRAIQPDVVHVHNLSNLSFDLPAMARARGAKVVATLHDYTLVCASGGQRIHRAEEYVCRAIDADRCARCFRESIFYAHMSLGRIAAATNRPGLLMTAARAVRRRFPSLSGAAARAARHLPLMPVSRADIDARMANARRVFDDVDLFVAPSPSLGEEFERLGLARSKIRVSDYGFQGLTAGRSLTPGGARDRLRIGFVGTLVWHKGVHVLLEAIQGLPTDAFDVTIFGDPEVFPHYSSQLRTQAAGLPVRFAGAVARERIAAAYAQIDVLVVPSLWLENSPLVIHEAFMAGVPVVAARIGGIADLIEDGVSGLLYDPTSAAELRTILAQLIADRRRLAALCAAAPAVKSIERDASDWDAFYAELTTRRDSGFGIQDSLRA